MNNKKFILKLDDILSNYDKIFVFENEEFEKQFFELLCEQVNEKIMVLSVNTLWNKNKNIYFGEISEEELDFITNLYYTYEFSDKMVVFSSKDSRFNGIWNLYNTGIINNEEMLELIVNG